MRHDRLSSIEDVREIERVPLRERVPFDDVHSMLRASRDRDPGAAAIRWLPAGRAADVPIDISFATLFSKVTQTANLLHGLGVSAGSAVSLLLPNLPEAHYALWGASAAGVANPINPLLQPAQIAQLMAAAGSRVLITGGRDKAFDVAAKANAVRSLYPGLETVIVVGEAGPELSDALQFDRSITGVADDLLASGRKILPHDPSVYFHTGGTTGAPKLAQQTHFNQVFMAWTCAFLMDLTATDRILTGLPLFHANAAVATGLAGFFAGASALLCGQEGYRNKATVADFWAIAARNGATVFSAVPTIYAALMDNLPAHREESSLRFGLCGAAPMPTSLFNAFENKTGVHILELYGMTESTAISTCNPRDGERRIGSIGIRCPYQDCRTVILDSGGAYLRDCEIDEVGTLLLSGPNLFPGYKQDEFNQGIWPLPGMFDSGDLARMDAAGYLWLAGRTKDLIIRGGHNIDPVVIEEALHRHPDVELAAAVGMPCPYAGEIPVAYVQLVEGSAATPEGLRDFARDHVPERPAAPVEIVVVREIPVTAVGKIFKPPLRQDAARRAVAAALAEQFPDAEIGIRADDAKGAMVCVTIANEADLPAARHCVEWLPTAVEIIPKFGKVST